MPKTKPQNTAQGYKALSLGLLTLLAFILAVLFIYFAARASIIADDFSYFNHYAQQGGPVAYVLDHYLTHNGRLGQASLFAFTYALFGQGAIQLVPMLLFTALVFALAYMIRFFVTFDGPRQLISYSLAVLLVAGGLLLSPSMFDSFLWLTASTVYLGGLAFSLLTFCLGLHLYRKQSGLLAALGLGLAAAWSGTFTEPLTICTGVTGFLILIYGVLKTDQQARLLGAALWLGSLAGFALVYFSPGTMARREYYGTEISISQILGSFPAELSRFISLSSEIGYLLVIIAALALYALASPRWREGMAPKLLLGLSLAIFTIYFLFHTFVARTGSPVLALRTLTNPAFSLAISVLLLTLALSKLALGRDKTLLALALAGVLALGSLLGLVGYADTTASALNMRSHYLELRAQSIQQELAQNPDGPIHFQPLPIILESEAVDLFWKDQGQIDWVIEAISRWYGVENLEQVLIINGPEGYCLPASPLVKPSMTCLVEE